MELTLLLFTPKGKREDLLLVVLNHLHHQWDLPVPELHNLAVSNKAVAFTLTSCLYRYLLWCQPEDVFNRLKGHPTLGGSWSRFESGRLHRVVHTVGWELSLIIQGGDESGFKVNLMIQSKRAKGKVGTWFEPSIYYLLSKALAYSIYVSLCLHPLLSLYFWATFYLLTLASEEGFICPTYQVNYIIAN